MMDTERSYTRLSRLPCLLVFLSFATVVVSQDPPCDPAVCNNRGVCRSDWMGAEVCTCDPQFSGPNCETHVCPDVSEMNEVTCYNGGYCSEIVQGEVYECLCTSNFTGKTCEKQATVCENGQLCFYGYCKDTVGTCECISGFEGPTCDTAQVKGRYFGMYQGGGGGTPWYTIFFAVVGSIGGVALLIGGYVYYMRQRNLQRSMGRFHELKQLDSHWDASGD